MPEWSHWRKKVDLDDYDERWRQMAEAGENPHGEADFVDDVLAGMRPAIGARRRVRHRTGGHRAGPRGTSTSSASTSTRTCSTGPGPRPPT